MQERGIQVPRLKGEMADIVACLYVAHYFDQEVSPPVPAGAQDKGCLGCHAARGRPGGR
jgi:hypothetical protein